MHLIALRDSSRSYGCVATVHNGAVGTDVPWPGTVLLGRDHEVANVSQLVRAGDVRLVTITGPGGVGKTRLALEVARRVGAELPDGAVFVDLAGVTDLRAVAATIAGTLEVGQSGTDDSVVALRRALARRELLLVLDNFEQVLAAADVPVGLVESCAGLRVLVTSRAPLRVRAERVFRLAALPVPIPATGSDVAALRQFASVELFCERAAAIRQDFQLDLDNADVIAGICRALDGLPLAIELAAARISHLKPAVLLERLVTPLSNAPLDTLGRGASDLPARQRTMRDTIAWSYDLLSPLEQRLLCRLSIFDGDCSLDAIEAVCSGPEPEGGAGAGLDGASLLDALAALVDLHLVEPDDRAPDEARFGMMVTIREFGREQLDVTEQLAVRSRHASYYATLVDEVAVALWSPAAEQWTPRRLERELVEVRAALRHFLETEDVVAGLRMATGAGRFWLNQGHIAEGRQWLAEFLGRRTLESIPVRERASALMWAARLAMDEVVSADPTARAAIVTELEEARSVAHSIDDEELELEALVHLTFILRPDDGLDRARSLLEEGIARAQLGSRWRLAELLVNASLFFHRAGEHERAAGLAADACALADQLGNERVSLITRLALWRTTPGTTRPGTAPVLADIVPRAEELGDRRILGWLYPAVASDALSAGRVADAARWFRASLQLSRDSGYWDTGAFGLMGAQAVAHLSDQPQAAARLYGVLAPRLAMVRRNLAAEQLHNWEGFIAAVRDALGIDAFDTAAGDGSSMTWDDALNEAITICQGEMEAADEPPSTRSRPHQAWDLELTDRELDVLRHIAAGGTNKDVAVALGITPKTVMHHSVAIYRKLGVRGRAEATAYAYRSNLIDGSRAT